MVVERGSLRVAANVGTRPVPVRLSPGAKRIVLASDESVRITDGDVYLPAQSLAIVQT